MMRYSCSKLNLIWSNLLLIWFGFHGQISTWHTSSSNTADIQWNGITTNLSLIGNNLNEIVCPHVVDVRHKNRQEVRVVVLRVDIFLYPWVPMFPFTCVSRKIKHQNQEESSNLRPFKDSKFRDAGRKKLNVIQPGTTTVTPTCIKLSYCVRGF